VLNYIWLALILGAVLIGGPAGKMKEVAEGAIKGAETAVTVALGLIGVMTLWLGLMRLAEKAGLVQALARFLRPALKRLFPEVPRNHPALGSMVLNIAANMLGLTNAATPFGLRAMRDLETLNSHPGTATNAMCTFLAINTASVQLIPVTAIAVLAAAGSKNPTAIVGTALLATFCACAAGLITVKTLEKMNIFAVKGSGSEKLTAQAAETEPGVPVAPAPEPISLWGWLVLAALFLLFGFSLIATAYPEMVNRPSPAGFQGSNGFIRLVNAISVLAIPFLVAFLPLLAAVRKIKIYEEFVEGAKEGFQVAIRIIPYLVGMLVAIGMFRGAGGIDLLTALFRPVLAAISFPPELLPIALMRPLSGSASLAIFTDIVKNFGADSLLARTAGTLYGSTETTFYVVAVYFGSVSVTRTRHAIPAGLIADATGALASVFICRWIFG
jgi:spore maturation protein SpmA